MFRTIIILIIIIIIWFDDTVTVTHLTNIQPHPHVRKRKHGRSLTVMPWTSTDEFNVIPKTTDEFSVISKTNNLATFSLLYVHQKICCNSEVVGYMVKICEIMIILSFKLAMSHDWFSIITIKHHFFLSAYPDSTTSGGITPSERITLRDTTPPAAIVLIENTMTPPMSSYENETGVKLIIIIMPSS